MGMYVPPKAEQNAAIASLRATGELPHDKYWNMVTARHDANPTRFDHFHPTLSVLLDRKDCMGPLVSDKLLKDYQQNASRFEKTHSGWITKLVKTELYLKQHPVVCGCGCNGGGAVICPLPPNPPYSACVPEPSTSMLLGIAVVMLAFVVRFK